MATAYPPDENMTDDSEDLINSSDECLNQNVTMIEQTYSIKLLKLQEMMKTQTHVDIFINLNGIVNQYKAKLLKNQ